MFLVRSDDDGDDQDNDSMGFRIVGGLVWTLARTRGEGCDDDDDDEKKRASEPEASVQ